MRAPTTGEWLSAGAVVLAAFISIVPWLWDRSPEARNDYNLYAREIDDAVKCSINGQGLPLVVLGEDAIIDLNKYIVVGTNTMRCQVTDHNNGLMFSYDLSVRNGDEEVWGEKDSCYENCEAVGNIVFEQEFKFVVPRAGS